MIKKLMRSVREFKVATIKAPVYISLEVIMECIIPLIMANLIDRGINVIITAHAAMRKFDQPDEMGSYDRWELKLINSKNSSIAGMVSDNFMSVLEYAVTFRNVDNVLVANNLCVGGNSNPKFPAWRRFDKTKITNLYVGNNGLFNLANSYTDG